MSGASDRADVLLIGKAEDVFVGDAAGRPPCEVRENVLEGIEAASAGQFSTLAVVFRAGRNFESALRALRRHSGGRIVLLARMWEEPAAKAMCDGGSVDGYVIYPVRAEEFVDAVSEDNRAVEGFVESDSAVKAKIAELEKLATEDDLTGLKNRRYILEFARQIIEKARADKRRVTLLVFDIDDFKHYNDTYGHAAGDGILREAAMLIRRCCRRHDVVGRIGGDEFAVIFWDDPKSVSEQAEQERRSSAGEHPREVIAIAKRFKKQLNGADMSLLGPEGKGELTISGGLATLGPDGDTVERLFEQADGALLEAKKRGKNRIYLVGGPPNDIDKIR